MNKLLATPCKAVTITLIMGVLIFQDSLTQLTGIDALNWLDECFVGLVAVFALYRSRHNVVSRKVWHALIFAILFWISGIVSGLVNSLSYLHIGTFIMGSVLMMKYAIMIVSFVAIKIRRQTLTYMRKGMLFWAWISVPAGLLNAFAYPIWHSIVPYVFRDVRLGISSAMGFFVHPGQYGWFMALCGSLYLAEYYYDRAKRGKLWKAVTLYACGLLSLKVKVVITIIAIVLFCVFFLDDKKHRMKRLIIGFVTLTVLAEVFGQLVLSAYDKYFTNLEGQSARQALLQAGQQIIVDHFPLGVGFSQFGSWYARVNYSHYYYIYGLTHVYGLSPENPMFATDTFWPAIMGESGALGFLFYICFLISLFLLLFENCRSMASDQQKVWVKPVCMFSILTFIQAVAESSGEAIFNSAPQNLFIGAIVGIALSYGPLTQTKVRYSKK